MSGDWNILKFEYIITAIIKLSISSKPFRKNATLVNKLSAANGVGT